MAVSIRIAVAAYQTFSHNVMQLRILPRAVIDETKHAFFFIGHIFTDPCFLPGFLRPPNQCPPLLRRPTLQPPRSGGSDRLYQNLHNIFPSPQHSAYHSPLPIALANPSSYALNKGSQHAFRSQQEPPLSPPAISDAEREVHICYQFWDRGDCCKTRCAQDPITVVCRPRQVHRPLR